MQAFDCNGIWWLPENPSVRVAGALHFSDDTGAALSLAGILGKPAVNLEKKTIPIILGLIWDCALGSAVTLQECRVKGFHTGSVGVAREDYFADRLFLGAHLEQHDHFFFSSLTVSLSGLSSWATAFSGLSYKLVPPDQGHRGGFEFQWLEPEPISGEVPGGHLDLGIGAKLSLPRRDYMITEEVAFHISCEQPQSADALNERYVCPLQNLLTLATDHPNVLVDFRIRRPGSRDDIHVLGPRVFHDLQAAADLLPYKMLFSLEDVRDQVVGLVSRWLEVVDRLDDVCNLYFGIQYKPDTFVDTKFFLVVQSLEVYQQRRHRTDGLILESSGPLLGELLSPLLEEHQATVGPLFGNDTTAAVAEVISYRNYVVHRNSDLGHNPNYSQNLYWLTQKLMFLMKACLLTELGISLVDQLKFFQRNQMYVHILSLAGK